MRDRAVFGVAMFLWSVCLVLVVLGTLAGPGAQYLVDLEATLDGIGR